MCSCACAQYLHCVCLQSLVSPEAVLDGDDDVVRAIDPGGIFDVIKVEAATDWVPNVNLVAHARVGAEPIVR